MVYKWKYPMAVSAEAAGKELEKMEQKHGHISPEIVLDESRAKKAVLHGLFEWDDKKAAEKYRLTQAGGIIRNLVVILDEQKSQEPVRAYVNVVPEQPARRGEFINIASAMMNESTRELTLEQAKRELKEFEKKYSNLSELADVFAAIRQIA
jgi:putative cell wall-binding protein